MTKIQTNKLNTVKSKKLLILTKSPETMRVLNEGANESSLSTSPNKRYILEGVFGVINSNSNKPNRNDRIYDEEEYLPHIQSIREDLKKGIPLLGELDHPMDGADGSPRFEVRVKETSHRILDVWYDKAKKLIMGRIELLNTPNGQIAKSLVDAGIPIYVSSRASGFVNPNKHVTIHKIFTWDIVAKPGFEEARVDLVNESLNESILEGVNKYYTYSNLNRDTLKNNYKDMSLKYNILNENTSIYEVEEECSKGKQVFPSLTPHSVPTKQIKNTNSKLGTLTTIEGVDYSLNDSDDDKEDKDKKPSILNLTYESPDEEKAFIIGVSTISVDELSPKEKNVYKIKQKKKDIEQKESNLDSKIKDYDDLIAKYESKKKTNENLTEKYPFFVDFTYSEQEKFKRLYEGEQDLFYELLYEGAKENSFSDTFQKVYNLREVNRSGKEEQKIWVEKAPNKYKDFYNNLSESEKAKVDEIASMFLFESDRDVNNFYEDTIGYMTESLRSKINEENDNKIFESLIDNYNNIVQSEEEFELGYDMSEIERYFGVE